MILNLISKMLKLNLEGLLRPEDKVIFAIFNQSQKLIVRYEAAMQSIGDVMFQVQASYRTVTNTFSI